MSAGERSGFGGAPETPLEAADAPEALEVFVYYDFASSLSYVAHRVLARIERQLADERVALRWKAIDLTGIGRFQRGRLLDPARRRSLLEVAAALDVELDPPERWPDSRLAGEVAVTLDMALDRGLDLAVEREWREEAFKAFYEPAAAAAGEPGVRPASAAAGSAGVSPASGSAESAGILPASEVPGATGTDSATGVVERLFRDFERRGHFGKRGVASIEDLAAGRRLAAATRSAAAAGVEGAPTLMFDVFPLCGIHDEETMLGMIRRYARRRRRLEAEASVRVN